MHDALSVLLLGEKPSFLPLIYATPSVFIQFDFFSENFPGNNIAQKATKDEKTETAKPRQN